MTYRHMLLQCCSGSNGGRSKSGADNITAYNIFGNIGTGPFNLDAEYMLGDVMQGADHEHKGYSVQVSYAL